MFQVFMMMQVGVNLAPWNSLVVTNVILPLVLECLDVRGAQAAST